MYSDDYGSIPADAFDNFDTVQTTASKNPPSATSPLLSSVGSGIGKAFDTFLDALAIQGANKIIGTQYPTGQQDPAALAAKTQATTTARPPMDWRPWAIGGGVLVGVVLLAAVVLPRKS